MKMIKKRYNVRMVCDDLNTAHNYEVYDNILNKPVVWCCYDNLVNALQKAKYLNNQQVNGQVMVHT